MMMIVVAVTGAHVLTPLLQREETDGVQVGIVAQLEERLLHTQEVIGSRPVGPIEEFSKLGGAKRPALSYVHMNVRTS